MKNIFYVQRAFPNGAFHERATIPDLHKNATLGGRIEFRVLATNFGSNYVARVIKGPKITRGVHLGRVRYCDGIRENIALP